MEKENEREKLRECEKQRERVNKGYGEIKKERDGDREAITCYSIYISLQFSI